MVTKAEQDFYDTFSLGPDMVIKFTCFGSIGEMLQYDKEQDEKREQDSCSNPEITPEILLKLINICNVYIGPRYNSVTVDELKDEVLTILTEEWLVRELNEDYSTDLYDDVCRAFTDEDEDDEDDEDYDFGDEDYDFEDDDDEDSYDD